jgi:hypothetical protein
MNQDSHETSAFPGSYIFAGVTSLMGLAGLFVAARAGHGAPYYGGITFFVFAVLFVFLLIKHAYDKSEGIAGGGLPLFVRFAAAAAIGYLVQGFAAASIPDKAMLAGIVAGVVVFAILAAVDRIAVRAE